jgi:hypothetical protein
VDPVPDPPLVGKSDSAGNRTRTSGFVARNSTRAQRRSEVKGTFVFLLEIFFRQLRGCYFAAPSLTRGQVCNLLLLLVLANAVPLGLPTLTRGRVCLLSVFCQYHSIASQYLHKILTLSVFDF